MTEAVVESVVLSFDLTAVCSNLVAKFALIMLPRMSTPAGPLPAFKAARPEKDAFRGERNAHGDFITFSPEAIAIGRFLGRSTELFEKEEEEEEGASETFVKDDDDDDGNEEEE